MKDNKVSAGPVTITVAHKPDERFGGAVVPVYEVDLVGQAAPGLDDAEVVRIGTFDALYTSVLKAVMCIAAERIKNAWGKRPTAELAGSGT